MHYYCCYCDLLRVWAQFEAGIHHPVAVCNRIFGKPGFHHLVRYSCWPFRHGNPIGHSSARTQPPFQLGFRPTEDQEVPSHACCCMLLSEVESLMMTGSRCCCCCCCCCYGGTWCNNCMMIAVLLFLLFNLLLCCCRSLVVHQWQCRYFVGRIPDRLFPKNV